MMGPLLPLYRVAPVSSVALRSVNDASDDGVREVQTWFDTKLFRSRWVNVQGPGFDDAYRYLPTLAESAKMIASVILDELAEICRILVENLISSYTHI